MSNKPTLYAYAVKDRGRNQKAIWTRIGVAWAHEKGPGFWIRLDALPLDGKCWRSHAIRRRQKPREAQLSDQIVESKTMDTIDITGLNFHQLEELRTRAEHRITEMRETGAPTLREQWGE
jgi:hypothetical protein